MSKCSRPKRRNRTQRGKDAVPNLPFRVMQSESYRLCSPTAKMLLLEFAFRFNGRNNGDLSMPLSAVRHWGIRSPNTLAACIRELVQHRLIVVTRKGKGGSGGALPNLYAITWQPVSEIKDKPDIKPMRSRSVFGEAATYE